MPKGRVRNSVIEIRYLKKSALKKLRAGEITQKQADKIIAQLDADLEVTKRVLAESRKLKRRREAAKKS
jgi:hypothetical protein